MSIALALSVAGGVQAGETPCGEACLKGVMHSYLDHMISGRPGDLRFSPRLVMRENNKLARPGEASWASMAKVRGGQLFADSSTGEVAFQGVLQEKNGALAVVFQRLKVVDGAITEAEAIVNDDPKSPMYVPQDIIEPDIIYAAPVPPQRRSSRAEIASIVTHYMDAIGLHDGKLASFSPRCDRYASGYKVTNNSKSEVDLGGGTCAESLDGLKGQNTIDRRIPLILPDLGIGVILFMIPHGERGKPSSTYVSEIIKVVDGRIRSIEEVSTSAAYPPNSGFASSN